MRRNHKVKVIDSSSMLHRKIEKKEILLKTKTDPPSTISVDWLRMGYWSPRIRSIHQYRIGKNTCNFTSEIKNNYTETLEGIISAIYCFIWEWIFFPVSSDGHEISKLQSSSNVQYNLKQLFIKKGACVKAQLIWCLFNFER